jgi:hypothetical protein
VGCSVAGGAQDCGRGAAEMADDGEQSRRRWSGGGAERRRSRGAKTRARESVNEVEEGSWTCYGNKKRHGELEQLLATGGVTWRLRATVVRCGRAGKSQQGSGER